MTDLSDYQILYHFEGTEQTLAIHKVTQEICLIKKLKIFNTGVYRYLMGHHNLHVPRIYEIWEENGVLTVAEEYVQGRTLNNILRAGQTDDGWKLHVFTDVCKAVEFLHAAEPPIIHRDIKTANVMITDDGIVKLMDYDAAKLYRADESEDTVLLGTRGNAAPEQYGFGSSDRRTDVYGLGCLLRELFPASQSAAEIAGKATQIDPDNRYQTVDGMLSAVRERLIPEADRGTVKFRQSNPRNSFPPELGGADIRTGTDHRKSGTGYAGIPAEEATHGQADIKEDRRASRFFRNLLHVPGFRKGKVWHAVTASLVYLFALWMCLTFEYTGARGPAEIALYRVIFVFIFFTGIDIAADWTGIWRGAPGYRSRKPLIRLTARIGYIAAGIFLWILVLAILDILLFGTS